MRFTHVITAASLAALGAAVGCSDSSGPSSAPVPTTVTLSGNLQSGIVGATLASPVGVTVKDQDGAPMSGVLVTFAVTAGGGVIMKPTDTTDAQGVASTSWILGNAVGAGNNGAGAAVQGYALAPPVFTASATALVSAYNMEIRFLTAMTPTQAAAFTAAAARWSSIVIGDLPSDQVVAAPGDCFYNSPAMDEVIDDIVIFASVDSIDGPGAILGGASPCWIRDVGSLTLVGGMVFDSADMGQLETLGILQATILHEMGHVLGIGTLWTYVTPVLLVGGGTANPYFNGANGVFRFDMDGGTSYAGTPVPVENLGGPGTADGHWRESIMGGELMTGYISFIGNPLSTITVGSLSDLGYTVSYLNSDPYTVSPINLRLGPTAENLHLREMRSPVAIKPVDALGRIRRAR